MSPSDLNLTLSLSAPSFHPILSLHVQPPSSLPLTCSLQARLSLKMPDEIFVDPDEIGDKFAGSAVTSWQITNAGTADKGKGKVKIDIERPTRKTSSEGLSVLELILVPRKASAWNEELDEILVLDVPLHGRYLAPSEKGETSILFPESDGEIRGQWTCDSNTQSVLPNLNPLPVEITLPTGKHSHQHLVELITPLCIWSGWAWLVYKMLRLRGRVSILGRAKKDI
ncbi:uncharacterized protein IL334_006989 [Kwoniella shivajii]|uniref:Protein PBN1 n=1 Tax=Kwoniella shivajii TaxID=564305 RepID=A0ABZ1DAJ8_9TREE|nr:hypothetical protein IL334_006989 [Kwoniella shivajii]